MKIIKVTSLSDKKSVYLNIEAIGHFYTVLEKREYGRLEKVEHTRIGITTHNNGGFEITETPEVIIKLINKELAKQV
jgi:hypothetical protein